MTDIFWFYHCGNCGVVSTKYHDACPVCKMTNSLNKDTAGIALKGSNAFPLPVSVGMQLEPKR